MREEKRAIQEPMNKTPDLNIVVATVDWSLELTFPFIFRARTDISFWFWLELMNSWHDVGLCLRDRARTIFGAQNINFTYSCFLRKVEWTKVENWPICGNLQKTPNFLRTLVGSLFVHTNQHLSTDLRATITAAAKFLRWLPEQGKFQFCTNTTQIFTAYIVHHTVKLWTFPSSPNMHLFIWGFVLLQFLAIHLSIFWLSWNNGGENTCFCKIYTPE